MMFEDELNKMLNIYYMEIVSLEYIFNFYYICDLRFRSYWIEHLSLNEPEIVKKNVTSVLI